MNFIRSCDVILVLCYGMISCENNFSFLFDLLQLVSQDKARCKMILNEFTSKMKMELCVYTTLLQAESPPFFVSSLVLNGTCYNGEAGKNKKEAEKLAASAALLSLLGKHLYY